MNNVGVCPSTPTPEPQVSSPIVLICTVLYKEIHHHFYYLFIIFHLVLLTERADRRSLLSTGGRRTFPSGLLSLQEDLGLLTVSLKFSSRLKCIKLQQVPADALLKYPNIHKIYLKIMLLYNI